MQYDCAAAFAELKANAPSTLPFEETKQKGQADSAGAWPSYNHSCGPRTAEAASRTKTVTLLWEQGMRAGALQKRGKTGFNGGQQA